MISRSRTGGGQEEGGRRQGRGRRLPPSDDQMFSFGSPNKVSGEGDRCVFGWFARLALPTPPSPHSLLPAHSSFHNITPLTRYQNTSAATVAARLASPPGPQPSPRTTETNAARSGPKRGRREKCPRSNRCTGGNRPHRRWGCPSKKSPTRRTIFRVARWRHALPGLPLRLLILPHAWRAPHRAPTD